MDIPLISGGLEFLGKDVRYLHDCVLDFTPGMTAPQFVICEWLVGEMSD